MENLPIASQRNSDVDFCDVFGGPPRRRASFYEPSQSSLDAHRPLRPLSGSGEKPVFGETGSPARWKHLGEDFFSDIYPGSDSSSCSSPKRTDRNSFVSSLPVQLSLSENLVKGIDHATISSPTHHSMYKKEAGSADDFDVWGSLKVPNDDVKNDVHAFYRQSPLSQQRNSHNLDKSFDVIDSTTPTIEVESQKDSTSLEGYVRSGQFHFSIYKWAGKGVTLLMPKENDGIRVRGLPEIVVRSVGLPSYSDNTPITNLESKKPNETQDSKSFKDLIIDKHDDGNSTAVEELFLGGSGTRSPHHDITEESDAHNTNREKIPVTVFEGQSSQLKNLHQLFDQDLRKHGNVDTVKKTKDTENFSRVQENVSSDDAIANKQIVRETVEDKLPQNRVKGKVKKFIKKFSQETSPKRKGIFETQYQRSRGKDGVQVKVDDHIIASLVKEAEESSDKSSSNSLLNTPTIINQFLKNADSPDSNMFSDVHMINDFSSEKKENMSPFLDSTPELIDAESTYEYFEEYLEEQIPDDQNEYLQPDPPQDQIKISDTKIREWSKGKEGNIRSLLSTLQYVLWPESGWKPVPLVDIIEGTSVKRAYQKALLCLHPDKLQQKGAADHQKYIAQKVFDILQEAWDHFNSISTF